MSDRAVIVFSIPSPFIDVDDFEVLYDKAKGVFSDRQDVKVHLGIKNTADLVEAIFSDEDSNLVQHAKRELEFESDEWFKEGIFAMLKIFSAQSHSGGSAAIATHLINELLQFNNITALTADPEEWQELGTNANGVIAWQSRRQPKAFSIDGGVTYYLVDDDDQTIHTSAPFVAAEDKKEDEQCSDISSPEQ